MAEHARLRIDAGIEIYFCDPHSPWQRGSNENTNGLLRQYFPKGTDLSRHSADELAAVAAALNTRPRKTLGWRTPAEALDEYLAAHQPERRRSGERRRLKFRNWVRSLRGRPLRLKAACGIVYDDLRPAFTRKPLLSTAKLRSPVVAR